MRLFEEREQDNADSVWTGAEEGLHWAGETSKDDAARVEHAKVCDESHIDRKDSDRGETRVEDLGMELGLENGSELVACVWGCEMVLVMLVRKDDGEISEGITVRKSRSFEAILASPATRSSQSFWALSLPMRLKAVDFRSPTVAASTREDLPAC